MKLFIEDIVFQNIKQNIYATSNMICVIYVW